MFLHLLRADRKFLGPIMRVFEGAAPGRHLYVAVGPVEDGFRLPEGVIHAEEPTVVPGVVAGRSDWEGVVLNGLSFATGGKCLDRLPRTVSVAWYVWGYEAYGYFDALKARLLLPETLRVQGVLEGHRNRRMPLTVRRLRRSERNARKLLRRLDYCVTSLREEHELLVGAGLPTSIQYHWGLVGSLNDYVDEHEAAGAGDSFQLGNSASPWNNHLDAFSLLCGPDRNARRVVVPLGYGDPRYRDMVAAAGREVLGKRFEPLLDFIPPDQYRAVIRTCGHVIMNHLRQQALGNIYDALWRGARVYLNDTTAYRGLRRAGFDVRLISEELSGLEQKPLRAATPEEAARHRGLLQEHYAFERVVEATTDLLSRLSAGSGRTQSSISEGRRSGRGGGEDG